MSESGDQVENKVDSASGSADVAVSEDTGSPTSEAPSLPSSNTASPAKQQDSKGSS